MSVSTARASGRLAMLAPVNYSKGEESPKAKRCKSWVPALTRKDRAADCVGRAGHTHKVVLRNGTSSLSAPCIPMERLPFPPRWLALFPPVVLALKLNAEDNYE